LIAELLDGRLTFVDPSPYSLRQWGIGKVSLLLLPSVCY